MCHQMYLCWPQYDLECRSPYSHRGWQKARNCSSGSLAGSSRLFKWTLSSTFIWLISQRTGWTSGHRHKSADRSTDMLLGCVPSALGFPFYRALRRPPPHDSAPDPNALLRKRRDFSAWWQGVCRCVCQMVSTAPKVPPRRYLRSQHTATFMPILRRRAA